MAHMLLVETHDFPGGTGSPQGPKNAMIPTQLKGVLHVVPHPASHLVVHHDGGDDCPAITSQVVGHGKGTGNRVTGMTTHTHIVIVQIPHHH